MCVVVGPVQKICSPSPFFFILKLSFFKMKAAITSTSWWKVFQQTKCTKETKQNASHGCSFVIICIFMIRRYDGEVYTDNGGVYNPTVMTPLWYRSKVKKNSIETSSNDRWTTIFKKNHFQNPISIKHKSFFQKFQLRQSAVHLIHYIELFVRYNRPIK